MVRTALSKPSDLTANPGFEINILPAGDKLRNNQRARESPRIGGSKKQPACIEDKSKGHPRPGVAAVRHKTGAKSFTYHAMANLYPDFARFEAEGTVFGSINKQNFENLRFVIPPPGIVAAYEQQAALLDEQIYNLEHQSLTLATLLDTLLPKLLSGELSFKSDH